MMSLGGVASADVPMKLAHQGRLFDAGGSPVEGSIDVTYTLYTKATGGTSLWTEHESAEVIDGYFASVLGDGTNLTADVFANENLYLSVTINGEELLPRTQLVSAPYAIVANDAVGDIHPRSVTIGSTQVIDANGKWIGDPTGLVGPQGPAGAAGPVGAVGPQGAAGADGAMGPQGPQGPMGPIGLMGPMGPIGPAGSDGATGPQGAPGLACWDKDQDGTCSMVEDVNASGNCDVADCVGAQGPIGPTGAVGPRGLQGDMGPVGPIGLTGATGAIGPQGPQGDTGATGAVGPIGPAGPVGLTGATGATGPQGPAGPIGPAGAMGPAGPVGATGATGPQGLVGQTGATGPAGPIGPIGATGAQGPQGPQGPAGTGGGVVLKDANNVTLGTVISIGQPVGGSGYTPAHTAYVVLKTSTGHIVPLGFDGLVVFGQMYWNGGGCDAGQGIMNSGSSTAVRKNFCKLVMRSTNGTLWTTGATGCDANGLVDSVQIGPTHIESTGVCNTTTSNNYGWRVTAVTNTDVGLPATIALPLSM
ncbi:MAG: collagen-like protein [Kofleriaceae bacterium]|nr:collagen-like protein [Kofleriaceae bacterium]